MSSEKSTYQELKPSKNLELFIHSYFSHSNNTSESEQKTIFPDSYFKIILLLKEGKVSNYFMTGLWSEQKDFTTPPDTTIFGCRLKILAPEFLLRNELASIHNSIKQLDLSYLNINELKTFTLEVFALHLEKEFNKNRSSRKIQANKLRLSQLLDKIQGNASASEVSDQIFWSNRQINRYLNKYLGISLKTYLNIQKCYESYLDIVKGTFFPEQDFFDQAHFIREIKKHTGETPSNLFKFQNDRFIQLKNIQKK